MGPYQILPNLAKKGLDTYKFVSKGENLKISKMLYISKKNKMPNKKFESNFFKSFISKAKSKKKIDI